MNTLEEERVVAALRALTGGLVVTEQDTLESRAHLTSRLTPSSPRRRTAVVLVAAAALIIVAAVVGLLIRAGDRDVVPQPVTPPTPAERLADALQPDAYAQPEAEFLAGRAPTAADLAGLWLLRNDSADRDTIPMIVDGRGLWRAGVPTYAFFWGASTVAGDTWTRQVDGRSECAREAGLASFSQEWRTALADDGSLHAMLASGSVTCTPMEDAEVWDRLVPGSPVADYLRTASEDANWQAFGPGPGLDGVYVAPATGHVLEIAPDGFRYFRSLADARLVAADRGRLDPDAASGTLSGTCQDGSFAARLESGEVAGVEGYLNASPALRIIPIADSCSSDLTDQGVWLQLFAGLTTLPVIDD